MNYQLQLRVFVDGTNYKALSIQVDASYDTTASTCVISLPKKVRVRTQSGIQAVNTTSLFKKLQSVHVVVGYDKRLWTVFTGFIDSIQPGGEACELRCKDAAVCLELFTVKKAWGKVSLSTIMREIQSQAGANWYFDRVQQHVDFDFEKYVISSARGHKIMENLKQYGVDSWVRDNVLHVGLQVVPSLQKTVTLDYSVHITNESGLTYQDKNVDLFVKGTSNTNGKKIEYEAGIRGGKEIQVNRANLDLEGLKKVVHYTLSRNPAAGYTGSFEMFGFPVIQHGDAVQLIDPAEPTHDTDYYLVKSVKTTASADGGLRQQVELAGKRI